LPDLDPHPGPANPDPFLFQQNVKPKLNFFPENFNKLSKIVKNYDTNDADKKDKGGRIRIRIWIGIKMESRSGIRIGINMMWIHNTVFSYVLRPESTGSTGPDPAQPLITAIRYSIMYV
jgi:hypothetical protein